MGEVGTWVDGKKGTYESTELLEALQHACNDECATIPTHAHKLREVIVDPGHL
jgi:hypothetical protein